MHPADRSGFRVLCTALIFIAVSCSQKKSTDEKPIASVKTDSLATVPKKVEKPQVTAEKTEKKLPNPPPPQKTVKAKPAREIKKQVTKNEEAKPIVVVEPVEKPEKKEVVNTPAKDTTTKKVVIAPKKDSVAKKPIVAKTGKPYYFKVVRKEDGKEVVGNLQLMELEGATQYQLIKSGEIIYLEKPKNKRGAYHLAALIPGYKQSEIVFVYDNPPIETGPNNEDIVTIALDKARSGDYIDFTNVHFFQNSSVMRPVSQTELDVLANLMMEDAKYKIKIYGYCNGKQDRDSYLMGTSTNFFTLDARANKKEKISSKELSLARAENVKAYLVSKGISAMRISTKGEGGAVPIYSETGNQSHYNDRVEVEFVK
ncbi:MAG: OmpA family protein [Bacteroidetes bacterium]|nr:OmpA family protein [Bacteroidota bacterium]